MYRNSFLQTTTTLRPPRQRLSSHGQTAKSQSPSTPIYFLSSLNDFHRGAAYGPHGTVLPSNRVPEHAIRPVGWLRFSNLRKNHRRKHGTPPHAPHQIPDPRRETTDIIVARVPDPCPTNIR